MDIHDIGANLERALLAEAWRHVPDGDGEDPLELGSGLRLSAQGSDSDALAELGAAVLRGELTCQALNRQIMLIIRIGISPRSKKCINVC